MGLFDVFVSEETCPICGKRSQMEFQTKALLNLLLRWKKGDVVETAKLIIKDRTIKDCFTSCPHCKEPLAGDVVIKDYRFLEIKKF